MKYVYVIEKAADGTYSAYAPDLPGCTTSGATLDEVRQNMRDAATLFVASLREHGELVPTPTSSVDTIDVSPDEGEGFGLAGAVLAAQVLPAEAFSDWEAPDGASGNGR